MPRIRGSLHISIYCLLAMSTYIYIYIYIYRSNKSRGDRRDYTAWLKTQTLHPGIFGLLGMKWSAFGCILRASRAARFSASLRLISSTNSCNHQGRSGVQHISCLSSVPFYSSTQLHIAPIYIYQFVKIHKCSEAAHRFQSCKSTWMAIYIHI